MAFSEGESYAVAISKQMLKQGSFMIIVEALKKEALIQYQLCPRRPYSSLCLELLTLASLSVCHSIVSVTSPGANVRQLCHHPSVKPCLASKAVGKFEVSCYCFQIQISWSQKKQCRLGKAIVMSTVCR